MIGLDRGAVEVVEHDSGWFILAAEACRVVRGACGGLLADVQHAGSTSVPGLLAKPVLDIAAGVIASDSLQEIVRKLSLVGYLYRGDHEDSGGHLFVAESSPDVRTAHLRVVQHAGSQWRYCLLFRDILRRRPAIRNRDSELKHRLSSLHREDRGAYTAATAEFIRQVLDSHAVASKDGPASDRRSKD
jgi:GrpB-like predicted nucleotidyltransferase (UPF0157 family)